MSSCVHMCFSEYAWISQDNIGVIIFNIRKFENLMIVLQSADQICSLQKFD